MTSPVPDMAQHIADEIQMERNAGLIMGTNNSSIVSKRSVERLYLPEPHFYRYFVRKPQRRSPTINRGYWLRMRAVDWVIRRFLEKPSDRPKIVMNLGCGYDPLPFHWMATERDLCNKTKFIDVDYEELMITKRDIINNTTRMKSLLGDEIEGSFDKSILLNCPEYAAVGCDLRNTSRLNDLLKSIAEIEDCLVLCVAEVSVTYMHTEAADALISWTSTLSSDVTFCLLEQGSPDRPDHPFTKTMVKHFAKLGTPLHSLFEYPGNHTQSLRFLRAGFSHCDTQNLWELWSDPQFLSPSQRLALDQIEPFDEWEEFALFASHYLLVVAHNRPDTTFPEQQRSRRDSTASIDSELSVRTASPFKGTSWFAMKYYADTSDDTKRHHASAYQVPDQDAIAIHGGIGPRSRLACTAVCRPKHLQGDPPVIIPSEVGARCCHTITTLVNGQNILVGGRGSPTQPMKDCWVQTGSQWTQIHDLPEPRYRHRTVPVTLPDGYFGAVVFGGKTGPSKVATTTLVWDPRTGWQVLESLGQTPVPRFGPSFVYLGFNHGLLFGGMRQDGVICQGLWRWRLVIRDNKVAGINFKQSNALDASVGAYPWFARLGASCGLVRDELLIIGGVAKSGTIPKLYEILSILGSFSSFMEQEKEMQLRLTCVEPVMAPDCPRPFFIGHSTHRTKTGTLAFLGGGATCFSFGNYYNSGVWLMHEREAGLRTDWVLVKTQPPMMSGSEKRLQHAFALAKETFSDVRPADISTSEDFLDYVRAPQPSVIRTLKLGPCLQRWTPSYLRSRISAERTVVIHNSPSRNMNFQRKDFAYKTLKFHDFMSTLTSPSSHVYLRALSAKNPIKTPANFEIDWPELASDVSIPAPFSSILTKVKHSSCLRVSNNVTMWLHYDVMANMLFQIHGIKKLVLFPPEDLERLSFPPGSTTSEIDIFLENIVSEEKPKQGKAQRGHDPARVSTDDKSISVPRGTTPRIVVLRPGDALFIPPLWAHTGMSLEHDTLVNSNGPSTRAPAEADNPPPDGAHISKLGLEPPTSNELSPSETDLFGVAAAAEPLSAQPRDRADKDVNRYTNIALNVFFRSLPDSAYSNGRDIYGNRDLAPYEDGRRDLDRIVSRFLSISATSLPSSTTDIEDVNGTAISSDSVLQNGTTRSDQEDNNLSGGGISRTDGQSKRRSAATSKADVSQSLFASIPKDITKAYLERLADELRIKAAAL